VERNSSSFSEPICSSIRASTSPENLRTSRPRARPRAVRRTRPARPSSGSSSRYGASKWCIDRLHSCLFMQFSARPNRTDNQRVYGIPAERFG